MRHLIRVATFVLGGVLGACAAYTYQLWSAQRNVSPAPIAPRTSQQPVGEITEITLERTTCYGSCPAYRVVLRNDGTATYFAGLHAEHQELYLGGARVERRGTYQGRINPCDFDRLVGLLERRDYFAMNMSYNGGLSDVPSSITSVIRNGERKIVTAGGYSGRIGYYRPSGMDEKPAGLWDIEEAIDGVRVSIDWERTGQ